MIEEKRITTPKELKQYVGKLIVCHYGWSINHTESLRILDKIEKSENKTSLMGCQIYGKFILRKKMNDQYDDYFCAHKSSLYSDCVDYVRLPTTEEKHIFMERYNKIRLELLKEL